MKKNEDDLKKLSEGQHDVTEQPTNVADNNTENTNSQTQEMDDS